MIKSARVNRREILCHKKAQKRRNTLCISNFCNEFVVQKSRRAPQTHLISGFPKKKGDRGRPRTRKRADASA